MNNYKKIYVGNQYLTKTGKAQIYTSLDKNNIKAYDIEICECFIQKNTSIKGLKVKVVDEELISKTGGIVQGMSGSPIIQNGKIVGAVTHVFVNDPTKGFGLYLDWMINE